MTLKSDAKLEEKLICCFKNDTNLVNFDLSAQSSQNFRFDWFLLCKVYNSQVGSPESPEMPELKSHKSHQILHQTNKLCSGKISSHKTVRIKFSADFRFSNKLYGKNENPETTEINRKFSK